MVELGADTIKELMELLRPFMEDDHNRRPFLVVALGNDAPVLQYIDWRGAVATFIPHMVDVLAKYGEITPEKQALWVLLKHVRSQVGVDIQQRIDKLLTLIDLQRSHSPAAYTKWTDIPETGYTYNPIISVYHEPDITTNSYNSLNRADSDDKNSDWVHSPHINIDYTKLHNSLTSEQWKTSDQETIKIMLKVANREEKGWLEIKDIEKFPRPCLQMINQLWEENSNGRFGFRIQKQIWNEARVQASEFDEIFIIFGKRVGWRSKKDWLRNYELFNFQSDALMGHLPTLRFPGVEKRTSWLGTWKESFKSFLILWENYL